MKLAAVLACALAAALAAAQPSASPSAGASASASASFSASASASASASETPSPPPSPSSSPDALAFYCAGREDGMRCVRLSGESQRAPCTSAFTYCTSGATGIIQPLALGTKCLWNGTDALVVSASDRRCALRSPSPTPTRSPTASVTPSPGSSASPSPVAPTPSASPTPFFSVEYSCAGRADGQYCARAAAEDPETDSMCTRAYFMCAHGVRQLLQPVTLGTACFNGYLIHEADARCSLPITRPSPDPTAPRPVGDCTDLDDGIYCGANTTATCSDSYFYCTHAMSSGLLPVASGTLCHLPSTTIVHEVDQRCFVAPGEEEDDVCFGAPDGDVQCVPYTGAYNATSACVDGFTTCEGGLSTFIQPVAPGTLCAAGRLVYETSLDCVDPDVVGVPGYMRTGLVLNGGNASNFIENPTLGQDFRQDIADTIGLLQSAVIIESLTDVGTTGATFNISANDTINRVLQAAYDGPAVLVGLRITLPARLSVLTGAYNGSVPGEWEQAAVSAVIRDRIAGMLADEDAFADSFILFTQSWESSTAQVLAPSLLSVAYSAYIDAVAPTPTGPSPAPSPVAGVSASPLPTVSAAPGTGGNTGGENGGNNGAVGAAADEPVNVGVIVGPIVAGVAVLAVLAVVGWGRLRSRAAHQHAAAVDDASIDDHHDAEAAAGDAGSDEHEHEGEGEGNDGHHSEAGTDEHHEPEADGGAATGDDGIDVEVHADEGAAADDAHAADAEDDGTADAAPASDDEAAAAEAAGAAEKRRKRSFRRGKASGKGHVELE